MTVSPQRVLARWRTSRVKQAVLRHQHIGLSRYAPAAGRLLRGRDLRQRAPQMHCARAAANLRPPRHRLAQGIVHLEHARTISESLQFAPVRGRQTRPRQPQDLPGRHVQQHRPAGRQFIQRLHLPAGHDIPAQRAQIRAHRIRNRLRPAARKRPPDRMGQDPQQHPEC